MITPISHERIQFSFIIKHHHLFSLLLNVTLYGCRIWLHFIEGCNEVKIHQQMLTASLKLKKNFIVLSTERKIIIFAIVSSLTFFCFFSDETSGQNYPSLLFSLSFSKKICIVYKCVWGRWEQIKSRDELTEKNTVLHKMNDNEMFWDDVII